MNPINRDPLLTAKAAAAYLGIQEQTLNRWRCEKRGPAYLKVSRQIRYKQSDIDAFIEASRVVMAG